MLVHTAQYDRNRAVSVPLTFYAPSSVYILLYVVNLDRVYEPMTRSPATCPGFLFNDRRAGVPSFHQGLLFTLLTLASANPFLLCRIRVSFRVAGFNNPAGDRTAVDSFRFRFCFCHVHTPRLTRRLSSLANS